GKFFWWEDYSQDTGISHSVIKDRLDSTKNSKEMASTNDPDDNHPIQTFGGAGADNPPIDIYEGENEWVAHVELAGVPRENVNV
ncbi:8669_t:CDS:2, partial [Ambispora leptoticha]